MAMLPMFMLIGVSVNKSFKLYFCNIYVRVALFLLFFCLRLCMQNILWFKRFMDRIYALYLGMGLHR